MPGISNSASFGGMLGRGTYGRWNSRGDFWRLLRLEFRTRRERVGRHAAGRGNYDGDVRGPLRFTMRPIHDQCYDCQRKDDHPPPTTFGDPPLGLRLCEEETFSLMGRAYAAAQIQSEPHG